MRKQASGFSLVEVLVALFITAILTALGASMVIGAVAGKERLEAAAGSARAVDLLHATLMADLSQLAPRAVRAPDGSRREHVFSGGEASLDGRLLAFARAGWDNPGGAEPRGSIVYVEYVHEDGRLLRRSWARLDPTAQTPVIERVLMTGVEEARVSFGDGAAWTPSFVTPARETTEDAFPPLVEVHLTVAGLGEIRQVFATGYGR